MRQIVEVPYLGQLAHEHLLASGYAYHHIPTEWWECGDPESGPAVDGHQAYDEYSLTLPNGDVEVIATDATCRVDREVFPGWLMGEDFDVAHYNQLEV